MKTITVVGNPSETTVNLTKQTGPSAASLYGGKADMQRFIFVASE